MRRFFLCLSIILSDNQFRAQNADSLLLNNAKNKQEYQIAAIHVEGLIAMDPSVVIMLSGLAKGDKITIPGDAVGDAIKRLWKQGLFEDIQILIEKVVGGDVFLIIKVVERPRLSSFKFTGNVKKNDADEIRGIIKLNREKVITDYQLGTIKHQIQQYYSDKGFFFAKVDLTKKADTAQKLPHVFLTINVWKGKKVRIAEVNFIGNTVVKSWQLRRKLEDTKRKRWYNPFNSGKYLEENVSKDLPAVAALYNTKGYRDARIIKDTVYFVDPKHVAIDIHVVEGNRYYFGNFKWFGNTKYRSGQLDTILNIHPGEIYDKGKLDQKLFMNPNGVDISSLYLDDGYLFFQIQDHESNIHNDTIDFDLMMYEGKQAIINKVTIKGNDKTNDHVIYREIRTRPGQLFRRSDILRTQRELSQLGYFDPEKMNVIPTPNAADGTVDIEYVVEEKPSDQVELSGGWGGQTTDGGTGLIGTLGLTFNNFSTKNMFKRNAWRPLPTGDGQRLSLRFQTNGLAYQTYNFSFTEPWLGGKKPHSLTFSAYHTLFNTNGVKKYIDVGNQKVINPERQSMSIIGGSIGLGRRLKWPDNYFNMVSSINYNYYELINYAAFDFLETGSGYANDPNLSINISRNSIDAPIYPKQGSNFVLSGQLTPPYSVLNGKDYSTLSSAEKYKFIEYQKYKITAEWFTQLTNQKAIKEGDEARNLVLRTKIGYGFLAPYRSAVGYSPFERFYMGGSGLSGYTNFVAREIVGLRGYTDNSISSTYGDPIVARYTMEVRYPVSLNPQATIYVLGFAEAGNTWANFRSFNPFQVKRSAGFGLRAYLPMFGLLGVDYGWGFDNIPGNTESGNGKGQFHFTIGGTLGEL